jgi:hypothetical protein
MCDVVILCYTQCGLHVLGLISLKIEGTTFFNTKQASLAYTWAFTQS